MSIIAPSDFTGEINIPQTSNYFENGGSLQMFIDKYEKKFLIELLGAELYAEFIAGLLVDPIPTKWTDLRNTTDLKDMLKNYIYYWYKRNETTQSVGISEIKPKAENATTQNSSDKMIRAWNEMVKMARLFDLSTVTYPAFVRVWWRSYPIWFYGCEVPDIFYPINLPNI